MKQLTTYNRAAAYGHVTDDMKRDSADRMESYMKTLSES